jgi:hypothetical protein
MVAQHVQHSPCAALSAEAATKAALVQQPPVCKLAAASNGLKGWDLGANAVLPANRPRQQGAGACSASIPGVV